MTPGDNNKTNMTNRIFVLKYWRLMQIPDPHSILANIWVAVFFGPFHTTPFHIGGVATDLALCLKLSNSELQLELYEIR